MPKAPSKPRNPPADLRVYDNEDELSLIDLWNIVWKRKWLWLTLGPLGGVIGFVIALVSTEIYRAEVLLAPTGDEDRPGGLSALASQFGGIAAVAGIDLGAGGDVQSAMATLQSRRFLYSFIADNDLLPVLFSDDWDAEDEIWKSNEENEIPTLWDAYEIFDDEILSVSQDAKTGLVTLAIEWRDAEQSAKWANELTERVNRFLREQAREETERNLSYLKDQLQETQVLEIRQSLYSLIESQTQKAMLANAKTEFAFQVVDPAYVPEEPVRPQRLLIVIATGMLGGFAGIFLCFGLHLKEQARSS